MLHLLYDSDSLRGLEEGGGRFLGGVVRAQDGQNSSGFIVFGGKDSIHIGQNLAVAAVKLTFSSLEPSKFAHMLRWLYDFDSLRGAEVGEAGFLGGEVVSLGFDR